MLLYYCLTLTVHIISDKLGQMGGFHRAGMVQAKTKKL